MGTQSHILVADDEPNLRKVLSALLTREGYDVVTAQDGEDALEKVHRLADALDVVITDLRMPKVDGMEVLSTVNRRFPQIPVVLITAFGSVGQAVEAVKAGAFDYVEKPFEQEQIRNVVQKAVAQGRKNRENDIATADETAGQFGLIGKSPQMTKVFQVIETVADTPSTVLITGESGTGKELVAKALHEQSGRKDKPFIKINCAAIPKNLMESELFGYEQGAFTGATHPKPGRFELAHEGTLFLDEIGEIPIEMQVKLLRAIQESEFERVGGIKTIKVDVRLITATNRDLQSEVDAGRFRDDLFYRLNVVPVHIPPLRDRGGDLPLLIEHILQKFAARLGKDVESISPEALDLLQAHSWPGNIRELENLLERTILFCDSSVIAPEHLPTLRAPSAVENEGELGSQGLKETVREHTARLEKDIIIKALRQTEGNVTKAAKLLRISRKSLQLKMKEFSLRDQL